MVESAAWKETLEKRGWLDLYQPAEELQAFLEEDAGAGRRACSSDIGLVK